MKEHQSEGVFIKRASFDFSASAFLSHNSIWNSALVSVTLYSPFGCTSPAFCKASQLVHCSH